MDTDKVLAWKQSLVYIAGLLIVVFSWMMSAWKVWLGILIALVGFALLIWNIIAMKNSDQVKTVKLALLIPKIIVSSVLFIITVFVVIGSAIM